VYAYLIEPIKHEGIERALDNRKMK